MYNTKRKIKNVTLLHGLLPTIVSISGGPGEGFLGGGGGVVGTYFLTKHKATRNEFFASPLPFMGV